MQKPTELIGQVETTNTLIELTGAFEGISSSKLAKIRSQALQASAFFSELWQIYSQIRVQKVFGFGRSQREEEVYEKELWILITSEGGFSGDIDKRLVEQTMAAYDPNKEDIIVVGHHGAGLLHDKGIQYTKFYKLPEQDQNINVGPLVQDIQDYKTSTVYYQKYKSLSEQNVEQIQLSKRVAEMGSNVKPGDDIISAVNYIFEPSVFAVIDYLERSMLGITLSQLVLDSKLAQYASRFKAMSAARAQAEDASHELSTKYHRAVRAVKDERLKETINSRRIVEATAE